MKTTFKFLVILLTLLTLNNANAADNSGIKPGDEKLTCSQIVEQYTDTEKKYDAAKINKDTPNEDTKALTDADNRLNQLTNLLASKNCN